MRRSLKGIKIWPFRIIAISFSLFQLYTAGTGSLPHLQQRTVHVGLALFLAFSLYSASKRTSKHDSVPPWDLFTGGLAVCVSVYVFLNQDNILTLSPPTYLGLSLGAIATIIVLEATRRTLGWIFPIMTLLIVLYALYGNYVPGMFGHSGFSLKYVINSIYLSDLGIWGYLTGVSATIIASFIIFGRILLFSGGGKTFIDIALRLAGKMSGGGALVAVTSSALFGMISGSGIADTATTGNFTIPLMKKIGYKPEFAAGVEAGASAGGQITPPVMGSGAFIMAEILGIPYIRIVSASIIPATLFFIGVFSSVFFYSKQNQLLSVPNNEIPSIRDVLSWYVSAPLFLPLAALIYFLVTGYTPTFAVFVSIVVAVGIYLISPGTKTSIKERAKAVLSGLEEGGYALAALVPLIVSANIVVNLVSITGIAPKFSSLITRFSTDSLFLALAIGALLCFILGMGLPSVAAYLLAVTMAGPGLLKLKLDPLVVHLFMYYTSILGLVTPPVCANVYVAAAIANTNWWKTAFMALRVSFVMIAIPFLFAYNPMLLLVNVSFNHLMWLILTTIIAVILLSASISGIPFTKKPLMARVVLGMVAMALLFMHF